MCCPLLECVLLFEYPPPTSRGCHQAAKVRAKPSVLSVSHQFQANVMTQEVVDRLLHRTHTTDQRIPLFYGANQDPQGNLEKH